MRSCDIRKNTLIRYDHYASATEHIDQTPTEYRAGQGKGRDTIACLEFATSRSPGRWRMHDLSCVSCTSWLTSGPSASSPLCNTSPAMRNCVNVAARSSISTAPALASLALKPRHFVRAAPAGPPSASADPGTGSKALSSHVTFVNFTDPDV